MTEELQPRIKAFLEMIEKRWKHRLEKFVSFSDSAVYAYYYLVAEAKKFDAGELDGEELSAATDAFMAELYNKLTMENSEWLKAKIGEILLRHSGDTRKVLLDASELVVELEPVRHTKEWVAKAEDSFKALRQFELADRLATALKPFDGDDLSPDSPVVKARELLTVKITKSWEDNVRQALKDLGGLRLRDVANEALRLKEKLVLVLSQKDIASDNRLTFFEARNLIEAFELNEIWVKKAESVLIAVIVEKTLMAANRTANFWRQNLPDQFVDKKVKALRDLLDLPIEDRNMLWTIHVEEAKKALAGHEPVCPGCGKNKLNRMDSKPGVKDGKGKFWNLCRDCMNPKTTALDLLKGASMPVEVSYATAEDIIALKAAMEGKPAKVNEKGGGKKKKKGKPVDEVKEEVYQ